MTPIENCQNRHIHFHAKCTYSNGLALIEHQGVTYSYSSFNEAFPVIALEIEKETKYPKAANPDGTKRWMQ